jgi:very-short-patch-repair endonuclease
MRRHRILSIRALQTLGMSMSAVSRRTSEGRLTRLHHEVYLVGPPPPSRHGRWLAAVIALGDRAVLSHRSAACLWEIADRDPTRVDVTVSGTKRASRIGISLHSTRSFHPDDVAAIDGIPATSIERTLIDLAEVARPLDVRRAYERAEQRQLIDHRKLRELAARSNGRRGLKLLLPLLQYDPTAAAEAWSELERLFHDLMHSSGLPPCQRNVEVEGFVVDAYWPEARLVVELQSFEHHARRFQFDEDHLKRARLMAARHRVLPVTHHQVTEGADELVATIAALLG